MQIAALMPFADWDYYYVDGDTLSWKPNPWQKFDAVEVPDGFVTDLTSIPRTFWQVVRPEGRYAYAAVIHDYLYWTQTRTRWEADEIFKFAMADSKVNPKILTAVHNAVSRFGQAAWDENARRKKRGECRVLRYKPRGLIVSWSEWRTTPMNFGDSNCRWN